MLLPADLRSLIAKKVADSELGKEDFCSTAFREATEAFLGKMAAEYEAARERCGA